MGFLEKMNGEGKTVILITHDLDLVTYARRTIHLKDGKIEREENSKKNIRRKNE